MKEKINKNMQGLTEKERKELEILDNPKIEFLSSPISAGPLVKIFGKHGKNRKDKVVELRTKMRIKELGIDPDRNWQRYYQIRREEEERFDKRFNSKKQYERKNN
jgi:hypothetical protein